MNERNRLHEAAVRLAEYGYKVFPCVPGAKNPIVAHGFKDATTDEATIATWWAGTPNANVGVATEGIYVIDIDPMEDGSPNYWMNTLTVEQVAELAKAPQTITPRNGVHLWFRQPDGVELRNTGRGEIAPRVDTRGTGGYVLVPPSVVKEHGAYWFSPGRELDCGPEELPVVPQFIIDKLNEAKKPKPVVAESATTGDSVEDIPEGQRNNTLTSIAGGYRRIGMSRDAIAAALQVANVERCKPPLDPAEVDQIAGSVARYEVDQTAQAVAEGWADQEASEEDERGPKDPGKFPQHLLQVGGIVEKIIAYNLATSHRPQPELALMGAICLLSTITGRKVEDEYRTRTNLYVIGLCPAGGGKDHARRLNKEILAEADMVQYIGNEDFKSGSGLLSALHEHQSLLFQIDELGKWLQQIANGGNGSGAGFLRDVVKALLNVYTSARSIIKTGAQADVNKVKTIKQPHAVIYATSIPTNVLESLSVENVNDGFLSRTLIVESSVGRSREKAPQNIDIPAEILDYVRWWGAYTPEGNLGSINPVARKMQTDPDGAELYRELSALAEAEQDAWPEYAGLWVRSSEMARKLAILHQLSLDREAVEVGVRSVSWACEFIEYAISRAVFLAHEWVADGKFEKLLKRIVRVVRAGKDGISRYQITRAVSNVPTREIDEAIQRLIHDGRIKKVSRKTGGRPADVYTVNSAETPMMNV